MNDTDATVRFNANWGVYVLFPEQINGFTVAGYEDRDVYVTVNNMPYWINHTYDEVLDILKEKGWILDCGKPVRIVGEIGSVTGVKHDDGKPRMDLLPFDSLEEVAKVLSYGAQKYGAHNWRKGFDYSRLVGATLRHLSAWQSGQDTDKETGLSHLAHAAASLLFIIAQEKEGTGKDDRYKTSEYKKAPK